MDNRSCAGLRTKSTCNRGSSGQVVRALDCCAKHRWFEPNPRIIVGMLSHCPPSSKWVPGGNTGEVKGGEERNWPPFLTMPAAQDRCPSNGHSTNVRNRAWDSPFNRGSTWVSFCRMRHSLCYGT